MPHSAASEQGRHCLHNAPKEVSGLTRPVHVQISSPGSTLPNTLKYFNIKLLHLVHVDVEAGANSAPNANTGGSAIAGTGELLKKGLHVHKDIAVFQWMMLCNKNHMTMCNTIFEHI